MTVQELINQLEQEDPGSTVIVQGEGEVISLDGSGYIGDDDDNPVPCVALFTEAW